MLWHSRTEPFFTACATGVCWKELPFVVQLNANTSIRVGQNQVWTWGNETGSSWRTTNDIGFGNRKSLTCVDMCKGKCADRTIPADWNRVTEILNVNSFLSDYTDFWGRNDPDMLEVRNYSRRLRSYKDLLTDNY